MPTTKGNLMELNPFLDPNGTLRVGGLLKHTKIPYVSKHQIILPILPKENHISKLIVREEIQDNIGKITDKLRSK